MAQNNITLFNFNDIEVRVVDQNNNPWFIVSDVCNVLEINNPSQAISSLDDEEKNTLIINEGNRGNPEKAIINESGLYSLILRSRKPEAKRFKKWVTSEVLPSIRKTGGYMISSNQYGGIVKSVLNRALVSLKEEWRAEFEALKASYDPSASFTTYFRPIISVLKEKKVPQKGRRAISCKCSCRLHKYLIRVGKSDMIRLSRETGRYVYHVDGIREWLEQEGNGIITAHIDRINGQGRFHLVPNA